MKNLKGPFKIEKLSDAHPLFAKLLASEAEQLKTLPDFSGDSSLFIFSDFGGEHKSADFSTYSILIYSGDKRDIFAAEAKKIRVKHGLSTPLERICI
jgi:hypothetical protein